MDSIRQVLKGSSRFRVVFLTFTVSGFALGFLPAQTNGSETTNVSESVAALKNIAPATPVLQIGAGKGTGGVNPMLYGLMTAEMNYSYQGSLMANSFATGRLKQIPKGRFSGRLSVTGSCPSTGISR